MEKKISFERKQNSIKERKKIKLRKEKKFFLKKRSISKFFEGK